ncbi:hypothetical protein ACIA48_23225 [Mycobacterium sp. NPDC051804]|uniref:hypothetical protein n=1 Tax=Mycobacterium sp. NPDC051804 TaxID=3364295 RepID=UPI0037B308DE
MPVSADPQTSIIRRHPTGEFPAAPAGSDPQTTHIQPDGADPQTSLIPRARPSAVTPKNPWPDPRPAIATAIFAIVSGWATAVIATDLITGWWETDLLFCVAIAFLTAISAAALIAGLIGLLLRRRASRLLIIVGAVVALLIFSSLFVAGARLPTIVYAIPALPLATIAFALLPATARWGRSSG